MSEISIKKETIENDTQRIIREIVQKYSPKKGEILLIGCSTSEVQGKNLGSASNDEIARVIFDTISAHTNPLGIKLAVQCCEHLNRCIVTSKDIAEKYMLDEVNAIPKPHAGGSFAAYAYQKIESPVLVENIRADFGIDIGLVMIGMNLKAVAVPLRLEQKTIGAAIVNSARTRAKYIGGERAIYNKDLM
ncbi:MAG: TIGR01440 family protein [Clostridiales bacterium]|nr:TIGR01440 family protein [Clostridiales bacterium]